MLIVRVYQKWLEAEQPNAAAQYQDGATEEEEEYISFEIGQRVVFRSLH